MFDDTVTRSTVTLSAPTGVHCFRYYNFQYNIWVWGTALADTGNDRVIRLETSLERYLSGSQPVDITSQGGHLYVVNKGLANVTEISQDLAPLYGTYVLGGLPVGITWNSARFNFYVTDASATRSVKAYASTFGTPVVSWTLTYEPGGIACNEGGFVYVADKTNRRVVKYTFDGRQVAAFTASSSYVPTGLHFSSNYLYISCRNPSSPSYGVVYRYTW